MTHVWAEKCVIKGKIAYNFPLVTHFWEICVTQGMSRNLTDIPWVTHFPLVTQLFSAKNCVTQVMSTVTQNICRLYMWEWDSITTTWLPTPGTICIQTFTFSYFHKYWDWQDIEEIWDNYAKASMISQTELLYIIKIEE